MEILQSSWTRSSGQSSAKRIAVRDREEPFPSPDAKSARALPAADRSPFFSGVFQLKIGVDSRAFGFVRRPKHLTDHAEPSSDLGVGFFAGVFRSFCKSAGRVLTDVADDDFARISQDVEFDAAEVGACEHAALYGTSCGAKDDGIGLVPAGRPAIRMTHAGELRVIPIESASPQHPFLRLRGFLDLPLAVVDHLIVRRLRAAALSLAEFPTFRQGILRHKSSCQEGTEKSGLPIAPFRNASRYGVPARRSRCPPRR